MKEISVYYNILYVHFKPFLKDLSINLVTTGKMQNVTFDTFQQKLRSEKLNYEGSLDSMAENLNIELRIVLDTLAPEQTETLLTRPKQPW